MGCHLRENRQFLLQYLVISLLACTVITNEDRVKEIYFQELQSGLVDGSLVLVDVRTPEELKSDGAIKGAVNIPVADVVDAFKDLSADEFQAKYGFKKDAKRIVISCRSGRRAEAAIYKLKGIIPFEHMLLYRGSFLDWQANGGAIIKE